MRQSLRHGASLDRLAAGRADRLRCLQLRINLGQDAGGGLRVKMCVWLGVSRGLDLAFLNAD